MLKIFVCLYIVISDDGVMQILEGYVYFLCQKCLFFDNFNLFCSYLCVYIYSLELMKKSFYVVFNMYQDFKKIKFIVIFKDNKVF